MLAVLSPAKKLDMAGPPAPLAPTQPELARRTAELAAVTRKLSRADLSRLMGISDTLADLNYQRFRSFAANPAPEAVRPAILAFAGDTYIGLQAQDFDAEDLAFAQDHLRILSGLYGLLRPLDLMQPYRLEMGTRLANPAGGDLYAFWGKDLAAKLDEDSKGVIVNLASEEYFKAVTTGKPQSRIVTCVFREIKDNKARIIGLMAKRARGMMARFIVRNRLTDPADLRGFDMAGYRFRPDLSDENRFEFTREDMPA